MTKRLLVLMAVLAASISARAVTCTVTAASTSQANVNAVINGPTHTAVDGDVICIPSGSSTWTSGVSIPSGIGFTIIGSGSPNAGSGSIVPSSSCASGTTITLNGTFTGLGPFKPTFGNSLTRISCMTLAYTGTGTSIGVTALGTCTSSGCPNLRMDNVTFSNWAGHGTVGGISYGINAMDGVFGVIDHNNIAGSSGQFLQLIEISHASYLGVGSYGDNSWAQTESYGTANNLYFEYNTFSYAGATEDEGTAGTNLNQGGCRVVVRNNTFNMDSTNVALAWHGTESNGRPRSCRSYEFYANTYNCPASATCQQVIGNRGGTGLVYDNTTNFAGSGGTLAFMTSWYGLQTYRIAGSIGGWGPCDGSSGYDTNDGTVYDSRAYTSGTTSTITVSGTPWTTNQWVSNGSPYSIHDTGQNSGSEIISNTSNQITYADLGVPGQYAATPGGGNFEILRATQCIDSGGGRGAGTLYDSLCAPAGINSPTCTVVAASEAASPAYAWTFTMVGSTPVNLMAPNTARIIANRDYYNETSNQAAQTSTTSPFNGSSGMGHGSAANRPTSCTTGVAYAEYSGGNFVQLDKCTSTNTWTSAVYTAYTNPHPLDTNGSQASTPTCSANCAGTYTGSTTATFANSNSGTTIMCYTTNGSTPVTNGSGTGCSTGTSLSGATGNVTISTTETVEVVAGTSTLTDSGILSEAYTINSSATSNIILGAGVVLGAGVKVP